MVTLQSLGPIQNHNFRWGSNLDSVDLTAAARFGGHQLDSTQTQQILS